MAKKVTNGHITNGHVSLGRDEYEAFLAREETFCQLATDNEKLKAINADLVVVSDSQAKRLIGIDVKVDYLDRLSQLQHLMLEVLRDPAKVASFADLSEFWRQWQAHTLEAVKNKKLTNDEVMKYEPDIFKTWRNWVHEAGKVGRALNAAGRVEREEAAPKTVKDVQEHLLRVLREDNAKLAMRLQQAEAELAAQKTKAGEKQP